MHFAEAIVALVYAMQMIISVLFAVDYKREKKGIPALVLACVGDYLIVNYLSLRNETWLYAFFCEIVFFLAIIGYFAEGNMWRNYMIVWMNFQTANLLISLEYYVINFFTSAKSTVIFFGAKNIGHVFIDWILMILNSLIALFVSRKLFKPNYKGNGTIYKVIVAVMTIGTAFVSAGRAVIILKERNSIDMMDKSEIYAVYIFTIAGVILLLLLSGYLYNLFEMRRLAKDRKALQEVLEKNHKRYMRVLENNRGLKKFRDMLKKGDVQLTEKLATESVSGNVLLDTVVLTHTDEFEEQGILFECIIPPMEEDLSKDKKLATIVDLLLKIAKQGTKNVREKRWIYFILKNIGDNTIVKLEFSKTKNKLKTTYDLKLLKKIIYNADGTIDIKDNGKDVEISVLA